MTEATNAFLPEGYEVPQSVSNYMKPKAGENKVRILASPIMGYLGWIEQLDEDGKEVRKPIRVRENEGFPPNLEVKDGKYFWALPVWNYAENRVQILELTQKTIIQSITNYAKDPDFGHPSGYDVVITRRGEKLNTEYSVIAKPPKPLGADIEAEWKAIRPTFDLTRLFDGGDPFDGDAPSKSESARAGEDRETTIKAIFATAKKLWPTISASPEPKETLKKKLVEELGVRIDSFGKATLPELNDAYLAMKSKESENFAEEAKASMDVVPDEPEDTGPLTDDDGNEIPF